MAGETILVIDAGQEIDQRMTTTLEAEGYLIYTVSSQEVNVEMAELLKPSLIYIKPVELSPTGLDPCKAVHGIPLLTKVPIIILASPRKAPGSEYFEEYGIVDFLEPTFGPEELVEKTGTILGKAPPFRHPEEDEPVRLDPEENEPVASPQTARRMAKKRPAFLLPAIGIGVLLVVSGAGFLAYRQFMPVREVPPSPAITPSVRVPSAAPETGSKSQVPPTRNVAEPSPPASSVPSAPPRQTSSFSLESGSQPPRRPFYSVQLGAFKNEDRAQALAKKFREKGYDAFTRPGLAKDRSPIYRVLVSKHEDRKAARKLAEEIRSREQVETTLYGE
jgi:cell division septation protein DedD